MTGFALDVRAFALLDLPPQRVRVLDLIDAEPGDTLASYAARLVGATDYTPQDWIGGVSLGGMLALEAARQYGTQGLALIASTTHPRYIRGIWHALASVAPEAPEIFLRKLFVSVPRTLHRIGMLQNEGRDLLVGIMEKFPIPLLRQLPPMIMAWPGCRPVAPLHRLHSRGDWMIRYDGEGQCHDLLPGRHHLLTVSHPGRTREFILSLLNEAGG